MTPRPQPLVDDDPWSRWVRRIVIALATVILCSCRSTSHVQQAGRPMEHDDVAQKTSTGEAKVAQVAYKSCAHSGQPGACPVCAQLASGEVRDYSDAAPPLAHEAGRGEDQYPESSEETGDEGQRPLTEGQRRIERAIMPPQAFAPPPLPCAGAGCSSAACGDGGPLPVDACGQWRPPGLPCPWPEDEYLCDGGDREIPVGVAPDWTVNGLDPEDAVAHFDTLDGRTLVEPSNRVCIYAPRFAAVRTVTRIEANEQTDHAVRVALPTKPLRQEEVQIAVSSLQREQPERQISAKLPESYETRQGDGAVSTALRPTGFIDVYLPFENFDVIRSGRFDQTEKARLAQAVAAAITWTSQQAAQVILDQKMAMALVSDQRAQTTFVVDDPRHNPKLRLIKVASTQDAHPGETVDFTLRFDNVGDQTIGNVVIVDNLTTRLEYVPGSTQASVDAEFRSTASESQSLVLRWEITKPLAPGQGGIIRFQCKVR